MQQFDVIICGAGPAGSTCALGLFDAGLNVALLDKQSFPREKICGDAYGGYAHKILNTISPAFGKKILEINKGVIAKRARFISPKGYAYELKLDGFYANLPRTELDNFLLQMVREETKTTILENTSAQKVSIEKEQVIVITSSGQELTAKMVIGCDGAHSVVQSALTGTRELITESCPGLRAYYKNVKNIETDCLEIHFLKEIPKGYFWIFPSTDGLANVGIGADKDVLTKHKINMRHIFMELVKISPQFKERFAEAELVGDIKGWTIPIGYFNSKLPISGNRLLLCGDAAALVDPATGEGIGPAMSSGRYAAWQIKKCFKENNFSAEFMKVYDKDIHKKYYRNYSRKTMITNLYYKMPFLMDWGIAFFSGSQKFQGRKY
ncbi:MAG: geranylgeranyl reductase family protein [Bacteroidota bacterium]